MHFITTTHSTDTSFARKQDVYNAYGCPVYEQAAVILN